jgi:hypothetical protein
MPSPINIYFWPKNAASIPLYRSEKNFTMAFITGFSLPAVAVPLVGIGCSVPILQSTGQLNSSSPWSHLLLLLHKTGSQAPFMQPIPYCRQSWLVLQVRLAGGSTGGPVDGWPSAGVGGVWSFVVTAPQSGLSLAKLPHKPLLPHVLDSAQPPDVLLPVWPGQHSTPCGAAQALQLLPQTSQDLLPKNTLQDMPLTVGTHVLTLPG